MKRLVLKIALAVLAVLVLGCAGVVYYIDQLAKWGVERGATYALGVPTTLADLDIGLTSGSVELAQLQVANPEGFSTEHFLGLGEARVAVTLGSLMGDTVELPELTLRDLDLNLEKKAGGSNYQPILDHLERLSASDGSTPAPTKTEPAKEGKKFVIRKVTVEDITVDAQLSAVGGGLTRVPVTIEKIELTDVGSGSDKGVLLSELTGIVTKAILTAVMRKAGHVLPEAIAGELGAGLERLGKFGDVTVHVVGGVSALVGGELKQLGGTGKDLIRGLGETGVDLLKDPGQTGENLRDTATNLKDGAKDAGKELKEGLGRLLGKEKKDEKKDEEKPGGGG